MYPEKQYTTSDEENGRRRMASNTNKILARTLVSSVVLVSIIDYNSLRVIRKSDRV